MTNPNPPTICANVAGPLQIWVDTGAANALEFLGWTTNGASIEQLAFQTPVFSDENGGEQGPPVDYQMFGNQHRVSLELSKFQQSVLTKLDARYNPNTSNGNVGVGMLLGCNSAVFRLLLWAPNFVRNYVNTVLLEPIEESPIGAQYTRARCSFTCNKNSAGVLFNTTST
jgi:hypothetical protein